MTTPTPDPDTIVWTLTREHLPGMRATWWHASAVCRHGTSRHRVIAASLERIRLQLDGLGAIHRTEYRCPCRKVELVVQE